MSACAAAGDPVGGGGPAALVVGATGGIGRAVSAVLVEERYAVSVTGRRWESVSALAQDLAAGSGEVEPIVGDVVTDDGARGMVATHVERFGRLDMLVLSAGTSQRRFLADTDARKIRRLL